MVTISDLKKCIKHFGKEYTRDRLIPLIKQFGPSSKFIYGMQEYPIGINYISTPEQPAESIDVSHLNFK